MTLANQIQLAGKIAGLKQLITSNQQCRPKVTFPKKRHLSSLLYMKTQLKQSNSLLHELEEELSHSLELLSQK